MFPFVHVCVYACLNVCLGVYTSVSVTMQVRTVCIFVCSTLSAYTFQGIRKDRHMFQSIRKDIFMWACRYVRMHGCISIGLHMCMNMHMHMGTSIRVYTFVHAYVCVSQCMCMYMCMCAGHVLSFHRSTEYMHRCHNQVFTSHPKFTSQAMPRPRQSTAISRWLPGLWLRLTRKSKVSKLKLHILDP